MVHRRNPVLLQPLAVFLLALGLILSGCTNKHVKNPLAEVGSKQPDKVLFDRAMDAMKHNKFDVSRITLQTLINTYPDSGYIARAKLGVGDSWYAAGGSAGFAQAEAEYKDFITFFPNMAEAAEAQLKIANIHYRQMEKPDRDYTHAKRAEEEYRLLMQQFPDSKLITEAKSRLLEVQEILAEREFRIGHFYFVRQSWPAAIARLKSLADTYPLYSSADETLFLLGQSYEKQVEAVRAANLVEVAKGTLIRSYSDEAAKAYGRILTRYPLLPRAVEAKARLAAMKYTQPQATPEAIEQNRQEQASRSDQGMTGKLWSNFSRHPDLHTAVRVGEPTMDEPKQTSAPEVLRAASNAVAEATKMASGNGNSNVSVEAVKSGEPAPNQPVPRSVTVPDKDTGIGELVPLSNGEAAPQVQAADVPQPAPAQLNEAAKPTEVRSDNVPQKQTESEQNSSSSKKKKKGLRRVF